jgi:hypothetical protein
MSFTNISTPDKIYYDIQISNIDDIDTLPPVLSFIETRNNPFLYESDKYYMSIIRFSLETPNLPVFIPTIQPSPNTDINLTIYSVTLQWINPLDTSQIFTSQQFITYVPQSNIATLPPNPTQTDNGLQYNTTGYYNIYNYQYFIYLINNAFTLAYQQLLTQVTSAELNLPSSYSPILSWDTSNNTAILNCDVLGYSTTSTNYIKIFFNTALAQLFSSFPVRITSASSYLGLNTQIITDSYNNSNIIQYPPYNPTYDAIQVFQEFSTIALWSPVTSIVFTSNTLPIVSNQVSTPIIYNNGNQLGSNGNNALISQVITDFISNEGTYKPNLVYEPSAQYRYIELLSNRPLNTFDLQVYWKDRQGVLIPFYLSSGCTATIKVLFTKKNSLGNYKQ